MRALVLTERNKLEVLHIPKPVPAADEVLLRIRACAICGSDVHGMDGESGTRLPPIVMGHEAAGEIVALGENAGGFALGQRVVFDSTEHCGVCRFCAAGEVNLCDSRRVFGMSCKSYSKNGAMAEYLAVKSRLLYPIPDTVSFDEAAMVQPLTIALHAVGRIPELQGVESAVVIGAGAIGLMIIAALKEYGVKNIVAVDLDEGRLETARAFGAGACVNSQDMGAALERLQELTVNGADISFEAVGIGATSLLSVNCLRKGGSSVWVGNVARTVNTPMQEIVSKQLTIYGATASAGEYKEALRLVSGGELNLKSLISATAPLEEGSYWFNRLRSGREPLLKIILHP